MSDSDYLGTILDIDSCTYKNVKSVFNFGSLRTQREPYPSSSRIGIETMNNERDFCKTVFQIVCM